MGTNSHFASSLVEIPRPALLSGDDGLPQTEWIMPFGGCAVWGWSVGSESLHSPPLGETVLAYDYPLLGVFWTLVLASLFFLVIFTIVWALFDNFRRKDHGGLAKAGWFLFILFLPLFGVFVYLIARPADVDAEGAQPQYR